MSLHARRRYIGAGRLTLRRSLHRHHLALHPAAGAASRRQVLEAPAVMVAVTSAAAGGGQTAGEALAAQSGGPDTEKGQLPASPCDLAHMRAHW